MEAKKKASYIRLLLLTSAQKYPYDATTWITQ